MYSVIMRYFFDISYPMIEELSRYFIIYSVFAYIGPLIKNGEHIKMDMLPNYLKGRKKYGLDLFINCLLLLAFIFLFWNGIKWVDSLVQMNMRTNSGLVLMALPAIAVPIGMFFSCVYVFQQIILDIYKFRVNYESHSSIEENSSKSINETTQQEEIATP
ncbi:TRAP transporter small permease subunit [Neobacillus vireti]